MKVNSTILALLFSSASGFKYDDLQDGHCPYAAGEIDAKPFDTRFLEGEWVNVYDRNMLNDHLKCYSARFTPFGNHDFEEEDRKPTYFEYQTVSIDENNKPTVRMGLALNFNFDEKNTAYGIAEHSAINPSGQMGDITKHEHGDYFDPWLWDSQFDRYMKVVDTNNQDYLVLYQCLESANYRDKKTG